jgi:hypothetical protein
MYKFYKKIEKCDDQDSRTNISDQTYNCRSVQSVTSEEVTDANKLYIGNSYKEEPEASQHAYTRLYAQPNNASQQVQANHSNQQPQLYHAGPQAQANHAGQQTQLNHAGLQTQVNHAIQQTQLNNASQQVNTNHASQQPQLNHAGQQLQLNHASQQPQLNHASQKPQLNHAGHHANNTGQQSEPNNSINTNMNFDVISVVHRKLQTIFIENENDLTIDQQIYSAERILYKTDSNVKQSEIIDNIECENLLRTKQSKCPTFNCDGIGNTNGRSRTHRTKNGCPQAAKQEDNKRDKFVENQSQLFRLDENSNIIEQAVTNDTQALTIVHSTDHDLTDNTSLISEDSKERVDDAVQSVQYLHSFTRGKIASTEGECNLNHASDQTEFIYPGLQEQVVDGSQQVVHGQLVHRDQQDNIDHRLHEQEIILAYSFGIFTSYHYIKEIYEIAQMHKNDKVNKHNFFEKNSIISIHNLIFKGAFQNGNYATKRKDQCSRETS